MWPRASAASEQHRLAGRAARRAFRPRRDQLVELEPGQSSGSGAAGAPGPYPGFELRNFSQRVDHFNFALNNATWNQRVLVSTDGGFDASNAGAPVMFFTGAEGGDITRLYGRDYGYVRAVAKKLGALLVFMEHRFFAKSVPVDASVWREKGAGGGAQPGGLGLLTVEQALADYSGIVTSVLDNHSAWAHPTVSFGGSLAGTLAALMRVRYPHLVDMAWSSSSPLLGYPGLADQFAWRKQVTQNFETLSPGCPDLARAGFKGIAGANTSRLRAAVPVCERAFGWEDIQQVAWGVLESDGEFCYPPSQSPIKAHCAAMANASKAEGGGGADIFVQLVKAGAQRYFSGPCLNLTAYKAEQDEPGAIAWDYLASTTIVHPIGANGVTDMFPAFNWSISSTEYFAKRDFGVTPDATHVPVQYGVAHMGRFVRSNSRILFVYGLRDPWHTLGVGVQSLSAGLPVITIADGSHCADTALPDTSVDTPTMVAGRAKVLAQLREWIAAVRLEKAAP